jgi:DNA recombination protein RmuC
MQKAAAGVVFCALVAFTRVMAGIGKQSIGPAAALITLPRMTETASALSAVSWPGWVLPLGVIALALLVVCAVLLAALWGRRARKPDDVTSREALRALLDQAAQSQTRLSGELREVQAGLRTEMAEGARAARQELAQSFAGFQEALLRQSAETTRTQNAQLDAFAQQLAQLRAALSETLVQQLQGMGESNARRIAEVRATLEAQLAQLQASNTAKLDEMRHTVDEKLQSTLQARLGESFKLVAERLDLVHRGLGEMQTLAQGVGDLKHLLTNVKTRGMFGEAQLGALLEQVFAPEQYAAQVATRPGSREVVDFAIRLPGKSGGAEEPVWLPIDAKFPGEDYERLLDAQQRADAAGAEGAARALEARVRLEAKSIAEKYVEPPHTTDFAILFLPAEGLYAEVLRRPGLMQALQREYRVTLAGPTTLLAMLNSLQMGFRTLALERRSSEVWQVLGAVKTEFAKFGEVLDKVKRQTQTMLNTLDETGKRTRAMNRKLREVEALPSEQTQALLPELEDGTAPAGANRGDDQG